jgi:hypothetical protein
MPWKNILVIVQQFYSFMYTHKCIHNKTTRPCPTTTQKGIIHPFCSIEHTQTQQKMVLSYNNNNNNNSIETTSCDARELCTPYLTNYSLSFTMMVV